MAKARTPPIPASTVVPLKQEKPASKTLLSLVQTILATHEAAINREVGAACAQAREEANLDASWMLDLSKGKWVKVPNDQPSAKVQEA